MDGSGPGRLTKKALKNNTIGSGRDSPDPRKVVRIPLVAKHLVGAPS